MAWFDALRERLRLSLWFIPGLFVSGAFVLSLVLLAVDRELDRGGQLPIGFGGTPEGARSVLSAIAQSMLTFTGLVFSITMLVLQLASTQLSPRVMRTFLRDRANQAVLGLFVATFVFALLVLREVRAEGPDADGFVPALSVWAAFTLALASVAAFIYYIDHMAHAIRSTTVIRRIAEETVDAIERLTGGDDGSPDDDAPPDPIGPADRIVTAEAPGVVVAIDTPALVDVATRFDTRLVVVPAVGAFVPAGGPLVRLAANASLDEDAVGVVRSAVRLGPERTMEQDVGFGFRQLVDIALRALSPGVNDPTTAVEALDRIHDLLRRIADHPAPPAVLRDEAGAPRVHLQPFDWPAAVRLGLEEITRTGAGQVQVERRLQAVITDLMAHVEPERHGPLRQAAALLADAQAQPGLT